MSIGAVALGRVCTQPAKQACFLMALCKKKEKGEIAIPKGIDILNYEKRRK